MQNKLLLLFLLFLGSFITEVRAQNLSACNFPPSGPPAQGAPNCLASCIWCDFSTLVDSNFIFLPGPKQLCIQVMLENPRYYGFVAGSTSITFEITALNCQGIDGLEGGVIENCNEVINCTDGHPGGAALPLFIPVTGLVIGQAYQLVIDGFNGDVCSYKISILDGSIMPPPLGAIGAIQGLSQVCPGGTVHYTIDPVPNAASYTWTSPPGTQINGLSSILTLPSATGNSVDITFGNTGGTICVSASNACNPPIQVCKTVTNTPLPIVNLPDLTICYQETPYYWEEAPNTPLVAPGTYTLTSSPYDSYIGCDSFVRQKIKILPWNIKTLPPIYLCQGEVYEINGFPYSTTGTYQETLTSYNGCDSIVNFSIFVIPVNAVALTPDTITCSTPSVPLSGIGSTTGSAVMYNWYNSTWQLISNAVTATATAPGIYYFVVKNSAAGHSCYDTATVNVIGDLSVPQVSAGAPKVLTCAQPTVQLQGTGSVGSQFSYFWTASNGGNIVSGSTTLTPTVNAVGTYKLRVTNNLNGCTATSNTSVTALSLPPTLTVAGGTLTCTVPTVVLQASTNAANGSTFTWTGPNGFSSSLQNPVVNVAGDYVLVVTDGASGCSSSGTATVVANNTPPGASASNGTINCITSSVNLNGNSGSSGAVFSWTGPNGFTSSLPNPNVTVEGVYQLVVTGTNGCVSSATSTVTLNNTLPGAVLSVSGNLNCHNPTVNLVTSSTANPANLEHIWANPDGSFDTTGTVALLVVNLPGIYSVVITNTVNGCTSTTQDTVIQFTNVTAGIDSQQNASCFGSTNGGLGVLAGGGNGSYAFNWNTGSTLASISGLGGGVYTVTVTDGEACTATVQATITEPAILVANVSATPQTANGTSDGTASTSPSGGTPAYSFIWSNGETTASIANLLPGFYTVTVTDTLGCTRVETATVNPYNCAIQVIILPTDVSCFGANNGSASADISNGTSPYTYVWNNGASTPTVSNLSPGQYSVSIVDAANCPVLLNFTISEPDTLLANATSTGSSGPGTNNGTANASPSGGSGTYTYAWSNGASTQSITDLAGGVYTVMVTDSKGCSAVQTVEVPVGNCGLLTNFLSISPSCNGLATGEATVVLTGGTDPFTFNWSSGGNAATESGLGAGTYVVQIIDVNGCSISDTVVITEPAALTLSPETVVNTPCIDTPEGSATVVAAGGTGVLSISWSDGQTGPTATGLVAGPIIATVIDENGCIETLDVTIQAVDVEAPALQADSVGVALGPIGVVTLTLQNLGATVSDNCTVSTVSITPNVFNCTNLGDHQVEISATDASGNVTSKTITVTIVDNSAPVLVCPPSIIHCFGDNLVTYNAPTATDNCLGIGGGFALVEGLPSGSTFPNGTTLTTYSYTDGQGNTGFCSLEITILSQIAISLDSILNDIGSQHIGAINLTVSGSLPPYSFEWLLDGQPFPDTTEDLSGLAGGDYRVIITDANGCAIESQLFTVKSLVATNNPEWTYSVGIFPNPTAGGVSVVFPDQLIGKEVYLSVYDVTGRRIMSQQSAGQKQLQLDLSNVADGLYSILIRMNDGQMAQKIVVQK